MAADVPDDKKATERLANERTFLAWVRTSISIMSLGFVIAKFGLWLRELAPQLSGRTPVHGSGMSEPVGAAMIGFGGLLAVLASWRFHVVNRQIDAGRVTADRGLIVLVTAGIAGLAVVMMVYVCLTATAAPK
jgi:putative membrane protein